MRTNKKVYYAFLIAITMAFTMPPQQAEAFNLSKSIKKLAKTKKDLAKHKFKAAQHKANMSRKGAEHKFKAAQHKANISRDGAEHKFRAAQHKANISRDGAEHKFRAAQHKANTSRDAVQVRAGIGALGAVAPVAAGFAGGALGTAGHTAGALAGTSLGVAGGAIGSTAGATTPALVGATGVGNAMTMAAPPVIKKPADGPQILPSSPGQQTIGGGAPTGNSGSTAVDVANNTGGPVVPVRCVWNCNGQEYVQFDGDSGGRTGHMMHAQ